MIVLLLEARNAAANVHEKMALFATAHVTIIGDRERTMHGRRNDSS